MEAVLASLVDRLERRLERIGRLELWLLLPLAVLLWPVLWLGLGLSWWAALLAASCALAAAYALTMARSAALVRAAAREVTRTWPPGGNAHLAAMRALCGLDDRLLLDGLLVMATGLPRRGYRAGLAALRRLVVLLELGRTSEEALAETRERIAHANAALATDFAGACEEVTAHAWEQPPVLVAAVAIRFQHRVLAGEPELRDLLPALGIAFEHIARRRLAAAGVGHEDPSDSPHPA